MRFSRIRNSVLSSRNETILCCGHSRQHQYSNFNKIASSIPKICDLKIGLVSSGFFLPLFTHLQKLT